MDKNISRGGGQSPLPMPAGAHVRWSSYRYRYPNCVSLNKD